MRWIQAMVLTGAMCVSAVWASAETQVVQRDGKWVLTFDGAPYFIKGAGGGASKEKLKAIGANSFRTWGTDNLKAQLDEAQRLGLTVTVGIWLDHEGKMTDYDDPAVGERQVEKVRKAVSAFKDHPAVLMWAIGNEMEGRNGAKVSIWKTVDQCAAVAKKLDPTRPTMTVLAELGGKRVENFNAYCPNIDILGINSYGGAPSVAERYRKLGGTRPFVLTEFGVGGPWELGRTAFKASLEPTSTEKGPWYRRAYDKAVTGASDLCLGSYAFTWGAKRETTETWFGMLLPDGSRLESVDVMSELWAGKPPANRCPKIQAIEVTETGAMHPGQTLHVKVQATDPENDALAYEWVLKREQTQFGQGGSFEPETATHADAIVKAGAGEAEIKLPADKAVYRLYVYVRDGQGGAATANVPLLVE